MKTRHILLISAAALTLYIVVLIQFSPSQQVPAQYSQTSAPVLPTQQAQQQPNTLSTSSMQHMLEQQAKQITHVETQEPAADRPIRVGFPQDPDTDHLDFSAPETIHIGAYLDPDTEHLRASSGELLRVGESKDPDNEPLPSTAQAVIHLGERKDPDFQ